MSQVSELVIHLFLGLPTHLVYLKYMNIKEQEACLLLYLYSDLKKFMYSAFVVLSILSHNLCFSTKTYLDVILYISFNPLYMDIFIRPRYFTPDVTNIADK